MVETRSLRGTSSPHPSASLGPFYFLPDSSLLAHPCASKDSSLGSFSSTFCDPRHLTCLSSLTLGLHSEVEKLKPCTEVTVDVSQTDRVPLPLSDLLAKLKVSVITAENESTTKGKEVSVSTVLSTESEVGESPRLLCSFYPEQAGLFTVAVLLDGHHIQASPLLLPILSDEEESLALEIVGLLRVKPEYKHVLQENVKDENSSKPNSVPSDVQPSCSKANIEGLKALMDKEMFFNKEYLDSPSAVVGEHGRTQKMVVEYEMLRRLERLSVEGTSLVKDEKNKFDIKNKEQTGGIFKVESNEGKKEEVPGIQGVVQNLPLGGQVVVKKVTAMRKPDQVLYQPPFSRQINSNGVGRGKGVPMHERGTRQVERLPKRGVLEHAGMVGCKNTKSKPVGRGNPLERVKKRRPEGEGAREENGPRVESIKYQDVQQGVKREKMIRKSPVKEDVEYDQRNTSNQRQLVLHQNSGGDGKYACHEGSIEQEKRKKAEAEKDEREEYWRKLEQQVGATKRVKRGSAEEARQAGARTQRTAFNSVHHLNQQNAQRLP